MDFFNLEVMSFLILDLDSHADAPTVHLMLWEWLYDRVSMTKSVGKMV